MTLNGLNGRVKRLESQWKAGSREEEPAVDWTKKLTEAHTRLADARRERRKQLGLEPED